VTKGDKNLASSASFQLDFEYLLRQLQDGRGDPDSGFA
jgi:hypothetical protein